MSERFVVDLGPALDRLRDELREELLIELRQELASARWPEWMAVETAARYLDVSPERLRKLIARRAVPYCQAGRGCRVLFARRDLDEWMEGQRKPAEEGA